MINAAIFARNPLDTDIPNQGVSTLGTPRTPDEWRVLQWELETFVCEGEYARGLTQILQSYVDHVNAPEQPSVWVSGFYGSGKSHLVRVLEYLWRNPTFPEGTPAAGRQARDLVGDLPEDVQRLLRELNTRGRQAGGVWSAAGTLNSGVAEFARMAFLQIAFRAAGLPEAYHQARLVLWLHERGVLGEVRGAVEAMGGDWAYELRNMFVSPRLAGAVRAHALTTLGNDDAVLEALRHQFPQVQDVSNEELVDALTAVFRFQTGGDRVPCTLFVLDELQQYIMDSNERAMQVQELVETCSKRFGGKVLVVATGQSAMGATPQLARIRGRFPLSVELSDADVENVIRQVILRKNPAALETLKGTLDATSGEIDRHLIGTKIAPRAEDRPVLVKDYPLLPTRRRFWEKVLRSIDRGGSSGQLRSQLRITHEASKAVARAEVGHVVGAEFIYGQQVAHMKQSGVLLPETDSMIARLNDGTDTGRLRQRLAQTIFLIGKLSAEEGVKANATTLADLVVEDLTAGSTALRSRIPEVLGELVERGEVMLVGDAYRLQTREGSEWTGAFNAANNRIVNDEVRLAQERGRLLRERVQATLKGVTAVQGATKTPRKIDLHYADSSPDLESGMVPVWVRDEWSTSLDTVRAEARAYGMEGPRGAVVHVHLPRHRADDLRRALAARLAASEVLTARTTVNTPEARDAQAAMKTRAEQANAEVTAIIAEVVEHARVFQGGGNEVGESGLRPSVQAAVQAALVRLYPQFGTADHPGWAMVFKQARLGNAGALEAVGHIGDAEKHPVCKAVLEAVGPGAKGGEVRRKFNGVPYGWPQDAIDGPLTLLTLTGHLRASLNGSPVEAKAIEASKVTQMDFRPESVTLSPVGRIQLRKLLSEAGIHVGPNQEGQGVARLLAALQDLAQKAGGEAPLPERRDTGWLRHGASLQGNEQLAWAHSKREELLAFHRDVSAQAELAEKRLPSWALLQRLLKHNRDETLAGQAEAIRAGRLLLDDVDPVLPLANDIMNDLRQKLMAALSSYGERYAAGLAELQVMPEWGRLDPPSQATVLRGAKLEEAPKLKLSSINDVVAELDRTPVSEWQTRTEALAPRLQKARKDVMERARPQARQVTLKGASIETPADVDRYLEELRRELLAHLEAGNPVVII